METSKVLEQAKPSNVSNDNNNNVFKGSSSSNQILESEQENRPRSNSNPTTASWEETSSSPKHKLQPPSSKKEWFAAKTPSNSSLMSSTGRARGAFLSRLSQLQEIPLSESSELETSNTVAGPLAKSAVAHENETDDSSSENSIQTHSTSEEDILFRSSEARSVEAIRRQSLLTLSEESWKESSSSPKKMTPSHRKTMSYDVAAPNRAQSIIFRGESGAHYLSGLESRIKGDMLSFLKLPNKDPFQTIDSPQGPCVISATKQNLLIALVNQSWRFSHAKKRGWSKTVSEKLLSNKNDLHPFIDHMVLTHHYFMTSAELLEFLILTYCQLSRNLAEAFDSTSYDTIKSLRTNILLTLKRWLQLCFSDFQNLEMGRKWEGWLSYLRSRKEDSAVEYLASEFKLKLILFNQSPEPRLKLDSKEKKITAISDFLDIPLSSLARQITLIESRIYRKISQEDLIGKKGTGQEFEYSEAVSAFYASSRILSLWLATEILSAANLKQRAAIFHRVLLLGKELLQLGNFHAASAVYHTLVLQPIIRLKNTWATLQSIKNRVYNEAWSKLQIFIPTNINDLLAKIKDQRAPYIIHINWLCQEFTRLHHRFTSFYKNDDKQALEFSTLSQIAELSFLFKTSTSSFYNIPDHSVIQGYLFSELTILNTKKLMAISLLYEPSQEAPAKSGLHSLAKGSQKFKLFEEQNISVSGPDSPFHQRLAKNIKNSDSIEQLFLNPLPFGGDSEVLYSPYAAFFQRTPNSSFQKTTDNKITKLLYYRPIEKGIVTFAGDAPKSLVDAFFFSMKNSLEQEEFISRLIGTAIDHCVKHPESTLVKVETVFFSEKPTLFRQLILRFSQGLLKSYFKALLHEKLFQNFPTTNFEFSLQLTKLCFLSLKEKNGPECFKHWCNILTNRVRLHHVQLLYSIGARFFMEFLIVPFVLNPPAKFEKYSKGVSYSFLTQCGPTIAGVFSKNEKNTLQNSLSLKAALKNTFEMFDSLLVIEKPNDAPRSVIALSADSQEPALEALKQFFVSSLEHFAQYCGSDLECFQGLLSTQVFNYPLFALTVRDRLEQKLRRTPQIPLILAELFDSVISNPIEGLFRIAPEKNEVEELVQLLDAGQRIESQRLKENPHLACSLIKTFFRELPEPPLGRLSDIEQIVMMTSDQDKLEALQKHFRTLPASSVALLKHLVQFIYEMERVSDVTKMPLNNLCSMFGPNLAKVESIGQPTIYLEINQLLMLIVSHADSVFVSIISLPNTPTNSESDSETPNINNNNKA